MRNIKTYNNFINEGIRDKMTPKSPEEINKYLDKILEGDYDTILENIIDSTFKNTLGVSYPDEVYCQILKEIDFNLLKEHIGDIITSVANTDFVRSVINKLRIKIKIEDIERHYFLFDLVYDISNRVGDIYYRDEIFRRLIKLNDLEKTKAIIRKLFAYNVSEGIRALMTPKSEDDIKKSLEYITNPTEMMKMGIEYGQTWLVKKAIDSGVEVGGYVKIYDSYKRECHSYLEYATSIGNVEIVKILMDNGAEEWGRDVDDSIRLAQSEWNIDILKILSPYKDWDEIEKKRNRLMNIK